MGLYEVYNTWNFYVVCRGILWAYMGILGGIGLQGFTFWAQGGGFGAPGHMSLQVAVLGYRVSVGTFT